MKLLLAALRCAVPLAIVCNVFTPAWSDPRIVTLKYSSSTIYPVRVQTGFAVQIVLDRGEQIVSAGTGRNSHCDDETAQWCVVAEAGSRDIFLNARSAAQHTNLFVKTTLRNYSFDLEPVGPGSKANAPLYRLQFVYQDEREPLASSRAKPASLPLALSDNVAAAQGALTPSIRNTSYTKQSNRGGAFIEPRAMWDDGRFTYLTFPNNRPVPAIYKVLDDGSESPVPFHVDDGGVMIVHEVDKRFVLRDGTAAVGLWNEAFDQDGVPPHGGTTVWGLSRAIRTGAAVEAPLPQPTGVTAQSGAADAAAVAAPIAQTLINAGKLLPGLAIPSARDTGSAQSDPWGDR